MNGGKVASNEKALLGIWCVLVAAWTCCCILLALSAVHEIDSETLHPTLESISQQATSKIEKSKTNVFWLSALVWGGGLGLAGGGCALFWKVRYRIEHEGSVISVHYSWPRKRLFVDGELQDEDDDFAFSEVVLHGRIESGDAANKEIRVSCRFGTYTPVRVNVDDRVVFKG